MSLAYQKTTENLILKIALSVTDSPYGMIGKINKEGKYNTLVYSSQTMQDCAYQPEEIKKLSTGMEIAHVWGIPLKTGKPFICNDISNHPESGGFPKGHVHLKAFLGIPLKSKDKIVGMIAVGKKEGKYTEKDKEDLIRIANSLCKVNGFDNGK